MTVAYGPSEPHPPCTVCAKPSSEHGTYPTCATHPYTPDAKCRHVLGAACVGAECQGGCVRARAAVSRSLDDAPSLIGVGTERIEAPTATHGAPHLYGVDDAPPQGEK
jgi:hypothetical protein